VKTDRLPPQAIDAEEGILSRCLMNDAEDAVELLKADDFYRTAHQKIFSTILELFWKKQPTDLISVTNALKDKGWIEEIGGAHYLAKLTNEIPLPVSVPHYANILREKAILRKLIILSNKTYQLCHETNISAEEILDDAQRSILNIDDREKGSIKELKEIVIDANERYARRFENRGELTGVTSGFFALDKLTCGFQGSDLILLGARPSMGKTAMALNTAANSARMGHAVLMFSLEMGESQVIDRMISSEAAVNGMKFKTGNFSTEDWERINKASSRVYDWPIYIDDSSSLSYMEIIRRSRRAKKQHDIQLIVIDYLQYITGEKGQGKNYEIESITRNLKAMAKDLNVPVLLLSQLNRQCEARPNPHKRPVLSDLRDSGAIEQDADLVLFLYRPERYGEKDRRGNDQPGVAEINFAKHRNGPLGTVRLRWLERVTRFENPYYHKNRQEE
jgi:replicative DNA helicase